MITTTSIGKLRGLQQCALPNGTFSILALDIRHNLRKTLNPRAPENVSDEDLVAIKLGIARALADESSAVLLDPEFGAAQSIASHSLPGHIGLIVALEATLHSGGSKLLPGWSVAKAKRMGASAVKLLVYYHPDSSWAADTETLIEQVAKDCRANDLPLFLESLSYSLDPGRRELPSEELRQVLTEIARRLTRLGIDVLETEFPVDAYNQHDEHKWAEACAELSQASQVPWVLLSAAVEYHTYLRQVVVACQNGASGAAVGRAVWQEAVDLSGEERANFMKGIARKRMRKVSNLCRTCGRPFSEFFSAGNTPLDWYRRYQEP
jgi:tagatose-1,6-bisphosphate aldolase